MAEHNELGTKGEDMAAHHLAENGYKILDRNWHFGKEEVDIIAQIDDQIVFVEVKTRGSSFFGRPEEFVKKQKQKFIIRAANTYIEKHDIDLEARFDIIGVIVSPRGKEINHIEDAFSPML
ncbi:MAG: YraN family protein [Bacteroidales bacterium]|nr:YraN family protein [Bacteroidales bacterium]MCF8328679.1 YraN family protein [Bacteroidales bacterium]